MTQSQNPEDNAPLADPEGVNAGSAAATDEAGTKDVADVEAGGDPDQAPDPRGGLTGYGATDDDSELVGTPDGEPAESGQDSGSIE